jgi:NitT/TauT family transport system permease protein
MDVNTGEHKSLLMGEVDQSLVPKPKPKKRIWVKIFQLGNSFLDWFRPNKIVSDKTKTTIIMMWILVLLTYWYKFSSPLVPRPHEIWKAFLDMWNNDGFGYELGVSMWLNAKAIFFSFIISLLLAYSYVFPVCQPVVKVFSKLRFMSLAGLVLLFTRAFNGYNLKLSIIVFSISVFYVTSMAAVIVAVTKEEMDYARTLGFSEWKVVREVIIFGKFDEAMETMRQCAAIGWMMLTGVEGLVRSGGGLGAKLLEQKKVFALDKVYAINFAILFVGIFQDAILGFLKTCLCPYEELEKERK